jgi:hypothetical protein
MWLTLLVETSGRGKFFPCTVAIRLLQQKLILSMHNGHQEQFEGSLGFLPSQWQSQTLPSSPQLAVSPSVPFSPPTAPPHPVATTLGRTLRNQIHCSYTGQQPRPPSHSPTLSYLVPPPLIPPNAGLPQLFSVKVLVSRTKFWSLCC